MAAEKDDSRIVPVHLPWQPNRLRPTPSIKRVVRRPFIQSLPVMPATNALLSSGATCGSPSACASQKSPRLCLSSRTGGSCLPQLITSRLRGGHGVGWWCGTSQALAPSLGSFGGSVSLSPTPAKACGEILNLRFIRGFIATLRLLAPSASTLHKNRLSLCAISCALYRKAARYSIRLSAPAPQRRRPFRPAASV